MEIIPELLAIELQYDFKSKTEISPPLLGDNTN